MAGDKIRIGLIGASTSYGWAMRSHLPALLALPEYELAAVCTSRPETAEESARAYGARLAFHDYTEMANHPEVDVVSVSVRVPHHHAMVMAALQAGKHTFCEWPLGADLAEAVEMADLARSKGVNSMVGLQARGNPTLLRLKELVEEGYVGEVLSANMTMFLPGVLARGSGSAWQADRTKGATALTIATGHSIDVLCLCLGEFREVSAHVATQVPTWDITDTGGTVDVTAPRQYTGKRSASQRCGCLCPRSQRAVAWQRLENGGLWKGGDPCRLFRSDGPTDRSGPSPWWRQGWRDGGDSHTRPFDHHSRRRARRLAHQRGPAISPAARWH